MYTKCEKGIAKYKLVWYNISVLTCKSVRESKVYCAFLSKKSKISGRFGAHTLALMQNNDCYFDMTDRKYCANFPSVAPNCNNKKQ